MTQIHTYSCTASFSGSNSQLQQAQDQLAIADRIWGILVDWDNWKNWWPGIVQLSRIDEGTIGRGSRFKIYTADSSQIWVINHWEPGQVLELIIDSKAKPCAMRISLNRNPLARSIDVQITGEYQFTAFQQLLAPLLLWHKSRQMRAVLESLKQAY